MPWDDFWTCLCCTGLCAVGGCCEQKKWIMIKSSLCLFVIVLLATIGASLDILVTQTGTSDDDVTDVKCWVVYGYDDIYLRVKNYDTGYNSTTTVTYSQAYNEICEDQDETDTAHCKRIHDLDVAGSIYIAFDSVGIFCGWSAFGICLMLTLGFHLYYYDRWHWCIPTKHVLAYQYVVTGFIFTAILSWIVAYSLLMNYWLKKLSKVVNVIFEYYYPIEYVSMDWNDGQLGISVALLIAATLMMTIAICCVMGLERIDENDYEEMRADEAQRRPILDGDGAAAAAAAENNEMNEGQEDGHLIVEA